MRYEKVDKAYQFLISKEKSEDSFSLDELAQATGWELSTCKSYPTKRWHQYVKRDGDTYTPTGIRLLSIEDFRAIHSQKLQQVKDNSDLGRLIQKAREFALLATSTYNNPFTKFKAHGFIVHIVIAWTALFHAIFEKNNQDYFYKDKNGKVKIVDGDKKAFELSSCFKLYWRDKNPPERANLDFLIGLRNKIEHRSLPALDVAVAGHCQSCLSNFEETLVQEFGDAYALTGNLAIALQLTRTSQDSQAEALRQLQTKQYNLVRKYIQDFQNNLQDDILSNQKFRLSVFLVPKLGNHARSADMAIEFVNMDNLSEDELAQYQQGIAFIKRLDSPYKYRPGQVVEKIARIHPLFNMTAHTSAWKKHEVRPKGKDPKFRGEYAGWVPGFDGYLYTEKWVNFLKSEITNK